MLTVGTRLGPYEITGSLEAAHERAIAHRDRKPANIKLRPDGTVKVLDFGLAKAMSADGIATTWRLDSGASRSMAS